MIAISALLLSGAVVAQEVRVAEPGSGPDPTLVREAIARLEAVGATLDRGPDGETVQAAAYAYAYRLVEKEPAIDSFILHRHVDHGQEGGLWLGLWSRDPKGPHAAAPLAKKRSYEVFRAADTAQWEEAFRFALPIVGLERWP